MRRGDRGAPTISFQATARHSSRWTSTASKTWCSKKLRNPAHICKRGEETMRTGISIWKSGKLAALSLTVVAGSLWVGTLARAADTTLGIGITLPLTGPDAE